MRNIFRDRKGFTFTEVMFVLIVSVFVVGATLSIWIFSHRAWTGENHRTDMRIGMLKTVETMRRDIRLSSTTYMSFYPGDSSVFTAIIMPLAEVDSNGFYTLDSATGLIDWDKAVVYHVVENDDKKTLRRTVIDPWTSSMEDPDNRYDLLESVADGTTGGTAYTDLIKNNLESMEIQSVAAFTDFYTDSTDPVKVENVVFGYAKLGSGSHDIRFTVTGQNDSATGYAFGIDNVRIAPCGSAREAEYYDSSYAPSGAISSSGSTTTRVHDTIWCNDNYLLYGASAEDDWLEFTDDYDLWRESSFSNAARDNVKLSGEEVRAALDLPDAFDDPEHANDPQNTMWHADEQAGADDVDGYVNPADPANAPADAIVIRTMAKNASLGLDPDEGQMMDLVRVKFRSASGWWNKLRIEKAYITRKDKAGASYNGLPNVSPSGKTPEEYHMHQQLFFEDTSEDFDSDGSTDDIVEGAVISGDLVNAGEIWSEWTAFPYIAEDDDGDEVDYFITFYVADTTKAECGYWPGSGVNSYYLSGADYSTAALEEAVGTPNWTASYTTVYSTGDIFVTSEIDTWESSGIVESQIFDSAVDDPVYSPIDASKYNPSGTTLTLKGRSSDDKDMTGATAWSSATSTPSSGGRYVQFLAEMETDLYWIHSTSSLSYADYIDEQITAPNPVYEFPKRSSEYLVTGVYTVWVDDVENAWPGETRICAIKGDIAKKSSYGRVKITVDGEDLVKVLRVDIAAAVDLEGRILREENTLEIEPRNTGK